MAYWNDINGRYEAISPQDAFAVLKALDSKAVAGNGSYETNDPSMAHDAIGRLDQNMKVTVNGITYDIKNVHNYDDSKYVYSHTAYKGSTDAIEARATRTVFNVFDVIAVAKAAGYDDESIANALNNHYRVKEIPKDAKNSFSSDAQIDFRTKEWDAGRVAYWGGNTTDAAKSLQKWVDENYKGAKVITTLDPEGNVYHYQIQYKDAAGKWHKVGVENPEGTTYTTTELDTIKASGVGAALQNQIENNNLVVNAESNLKLLDELKKNIASGADATTNFDLSDADYKALTVAFPDFEKQIVSNGVINSKWIDDMGKQLTQQTPTTFEGATLEEFIDNAQNSNAAGSDIRKAEFDKAASVLQQLKSNPDVYKAVMDQFNVDTHQNTIAGQRAANVAKAAQAASTEGLPSKAAESLAQLATVGADSLSDAERADIYKNLTTALNTYTNQQLNKAHADQTFAADEASKLGIMISNILGAIGAEESAANRHLQDETSRVNRETALRDAAYKAEGAESQAKNNVYTGTNQTVKDAIDGLLTSDSDNSAAAEVLKQYITGKDANGNPVTDMYTDSSGAEALRVNPDLIDPNKHYIDETTYNRIINDPAYKEILTQEAFDKYTTALSAGEMADKYGLEYLKDVNSTVNKFTDFADQANKASDRVLTQAQRAYLSALAAGDVQTIQSLTKLAGTAGAPKQNLLNASALSQQFAQQQKDVAVGTNLIKNAQAQRAANTKQLADATAAGRESWLNWLGSGNPSKDNGLYAAVTQGLTNTSANLGSYSNLVDAVMKHQTINNNLISDSVKASNDALTELATSMTGINSSGKVNNITNSGLSNQLKTEIDVRKQQLQSIIDQNDPTKKKTTIK